MIRNRIPSAMALAAMAFVSHHSATAQVAFSESFEAPVVSGYVANTVPSNGKWIGATVGFGASSRGLYRPDLQWPAAAPFSTPYGEQAYFCNYVNSGITTAVGATGQTLTAGVNYQLTFHAAASAGYPTANYRVELVAFGPTDDNTLRKECRSGRPGTVLAFANGSVTTTDMSSRFTISFTPDGANAHLGKDLGIRLLYVGSGSTTSVLYDNIRLIAGHDLNPSPANGESLDAGGNVTLGWTNMPPVAPSSTTPVDVWFGSNPAALTQVVDGQLVSSKIVSAPAAGTWYWRVDSYPDGNANGTPVTGQVFSFTIADTDGDGLPDTWESQYFGGTTAANAGIDSDSDGLTNSQEYIRGTNPKVADTDADGLLDGVESATGTWAGASNTGTHPLIADSDKDGFLDGVETNTGTWISAAGTGTNPNDPDWDKDGLKDGAETNTGIYVNRFNAGSNPFLTDTDGDGAGDWYEACATFTNPGSAAQTSPIPYPIPKPDGSTGVSNKPVKVYIVMGQSNATGIAQVNGTALGTLETTVKRESKFPNLLDASNNWLPRNDVLFRRAAIAAPAGPLAPGQGASTGQIGPELGFGQVMGWFHDEPVLILKASQGNRSLGGDFLPPGSGRWDFNGSTYAAYGESPASWPIGTIPAPNSWYAGRQYDICFRNLPDYAVPPASWAAATAYVSGDRIAHNGQIYSCLSNHTSDATTEPGVGATWTSRWENSDSIAEILANFGTLYPQWATQGHEIAGFCWWQGHFDQGTPAYADRYQQNLVNYINAVRAEFNAPNAPFVVATIGFGGEPLSNKTTTFQQVFNAQMAVQELPQFAGTVKSVDILKYWRTPEESPKNEDYHYNQNAETYMLVGDAMGRAMLEMQDDTTPPSPNPPTFAIAPAAVNATTIGMVAATAVDVSGPVQYYFENTTNSSNSGWITGTRWDNTGLATGVSHNFRFKAKDSKGNETAWSTVLGAAPGNDTTSPVPSPMSFAGPLTVLGETSIAMTASTASDINGVEYQFVCTVGGGPNSFWQSGPEFTAAGLSPATSYTYVVRARDSAGNTTADSAPASATTLAPDTTAPSPATMSFASPPTAQGINSITMTATNATDPSGVEYFFEAVNGGTSSGWQNSPIYTDSTLNPGTEYGYRVRARDKSPAQNTTAWSAVFNATTDVPDLTAPTISQLSPLKSATNVPVTANLVITFDEEITVGTGSITLKNLTDSTQTTIAVTDASQVSTSGPILTINPAANLAYGKNFAIRIDATAIKDLSDNPFAGISNDTTWSFSTPLFTTLQWDHNGDGTRSDGASSWAAPAILNRWWNGTVSLNWPNNPSSRDDAEFGFGGAGGTVNLGDGSQPNPIYAGNITFNNFTGQYAIFKGNLDFDGVITINAGAGRVHFDNAAVKGTGSIVLNSGILSLRTGLTYTGTTTANGGTLWLTEKAGMSPGSVFTVKNGVLVKVDISTSSTAGFSPGISGAGSLGGLLAGTTSGNKSITYNGMIGLELNPRATDSGDFAGSIGNLAGGGTVGNLAINSGTATYALTLSGTGHSYTGSTTVTKGILRLTNNSALPDTTTVYIPSSSNGKIHLDFTGTDYIAGLVLGGGTPLASGTYNATTHPAYFTGGGSLTVGSPPSVNPYDTWAGGGPGLPFDGDANGDGVDNGLAFLLGAAGPNVNALGKLPAPTESAGGLNLAFQMLPSTTRGGATLAIEHGNGLANGLWTTVAVPDTSGTVGDVIFTITGTNPLNVIATIPASKAAAGKLFGRLKAVKP